MFRHFIQQKQHKLPKVVRQILCIFFSFSIFLNSSSPAFADVVKIISVENISRTVSVNEEFKLPKTVPATMSNKVIQNVAVTWNTKQVSTEKTGTYTFTGTIKGYKKKISLTLKVTFASENNEEINRGITLGIVPKELQSDYDKTLTFAQYSKLLTNLVRIWDKNKLSEWKKKIALAAVSNKEMHREDGILATAYAMVLMGANRLDAIYDNTIQISQEEIDLQMKDLSWNYPLFPDWEKKTFGNSNYMWGGVCTSIQKVSKKSLQAIYPYDFKTHSLHLQKPLNRRDGIIAVIRLAETDPRILEPKATYVSVNKVGTYNHSIITKESLSKASQLPMPTQESLPSSWKGVGLSARKDGRHVYRDFSESDIRFMADNGFNFTRVFLGFDTLRFPDYPKDASLVNERELEELDQLIAWGIKYGVHIQISMIKIPSTKAEGWKGADYPKAKEWQLMQEYWTMFGRRYAGISSRYVSFDLANELEPDVNRIKDASKEIKKVVEGIRGVDVNRVLLYSFQGNPRLEWVDAMASLGLAIGCHPYYPQYIATSDSSYAQMNPYAVPVWPVVWFPMGKISNGRAPLVLTGAVSDSELSLHFHNSSESVKVEVIADGKTIESFKPQGSLGDDGQYYYYDKLYKAAIPSGTKEVKVQISEGYAYIDTVILKGTFGEVRMMPHDVCDYFDDADPLVLVVSSNGTYTNSENRMIEGNGVFEADILPMFDIAKKYKVGFMINEFGIFGTKVYWDNKVVAAYHDSVLRMLEEKGIGWSYCELYNYFGKHIVLMTGESQWKGTTVSKKTYTYKDHVDTIYYNKELLEVFRKYTK